MEKLIERSMYMSRWLLAPIYLGLTIALVMLSVKFFQEAYHVMPVLFSSEGLDEGGLILKVLAMVDMAMVGGLIVMVMFSGYENFVSKLEIDGAEKLDWMGKLDAGTLKQKVAASIVAISSIHLLQKFIGVEQLYNGGDSSDPAVKLVVAQNANEMLMWFVIIHLTFVLSAFCMGYLDKMTKHAH